MTSNQSKADYILSKIKQEDAVKGKGVLKIFFGMCAGVGKTYSMLAEANELAQSGKKIVVGYVETHGRVETEKLLSGLDIIDRKKVLYKNIQFDEFDIDAILELKPDYVVVDELAHTNVPGSKHAKRYQDVLELIDSGINVLTTLNVQHVESRSETVEKITGVKVTETVPDSIIELAEYIELVDIPIDELLKRLTTGKVYLPEKILLAKDNFFRPGNLISLREMALRLTADKVENDLVDYMERKNISGPWKAGNKLLVAVGSSPFSAELIKWTRQMAYSLKSQWIAVYVKTEAQLDKDSSIQLEKNLRLAQELGAETITYAATDFVTGIIEVAQRRNVSMIIAGKPAKYSLFNYLKKNNYIDRLIEESGDIDVYVMRPNSAIAKASSKRKKLLAISSSPKQYAISAASVLILAGICYPFANQLGYQSIGLIFLLNVLAQAFFLGRGPVILTALLNTVIWNFFFIPPLFTFEIDKLQDLLTLLINFGIAISGGIFSTKLKDQQALIKSREKRVSALLRFARELSKAESKFVAVSTALKHIDDNLNVNATFFNDSNQALISSRDLYEFDDKEKSVISWTLDHNRISGKNTDNLPDSIAQYFPVTTSRMKIGVVGLLLNRRLEVEEENLINVILSQLASYYEKEANNAKIRELMVDDASKKLYDTLIDSISHEFRTPISVISGASTMLFDSKATNNPEIVSELANEIYDASKRMDMLVENLLDINRLESGKLTTKQDYYPINEIIIEALMQIEKNKGDRKFFLNLDNSMPISFVDFGFLRQALINIFHNACVYTPDNSTIKISTGIFDSKIRIEIADDGNGVDETELPKLFNKFFRGEKSKPGGSGLGLSIAKGFIEANSGTIKAVANEPRGLKFIIELPYDDK
jgi:two-component system sensor histidine kinase KdpD